MRTLLTRKIRNPRSDKNKTYFDKYILKNKNKGFFSHFEEDFQNIKDWMTSIIFARMWWFNHVQRWTEVPTAIELFRIIPVVYLTNYLVYILVFFYDESRNGIVAVSNSHKSMSAITDITLFSFFLSNIQYYCLIFDFWYFIFIIVH